jgi:hypothetical protein
MRNQKNGLLDSFDKESFKAEFENAIPQMIAEVSDLFERRPARVPKRDKRKIAEDMAWGIEVSIPHVKTLEQISGDLTQVDKGYRILEELFGTYLRRAKMRARLKPGEDLFDYFLRKYWRELRPPYRMKRLKQYRIVREGIEQLLMSVVSHPGGIEAAQQLTEEFERKHLKEYMRYANALNARLNSYRNINMERMTHQNITRLTDLYRDAAAAFENRLRLLVGLNHIACGKAKTYDDLRKLGYNELLQAVNSSDNPLLHFLQGSVDRHVRNALMHAGVSSSLSKGVVSFADRKNEVEWTMSEFIRRTRNLILTILAVEYLEPLFNYVRAYYTFAAVHYLRANPPGDSPICSDVDSTASKAARATA